MANNAPCLGKSVAAPSRAALLVPVSALIGAGALLGISTNLTKVASSIDIRPEAFLFWSTMGASVILVIVATLRGMLPRLTVETGRYFLISAFLTVAGSNLILFKAVPFVGVSFVVLALTLPPVMTYMGALVLGMEQRCLMRFGGIGLAFAGSGYLAIRQLALPDVSPLWIALTLLAPILLAGGNIYRTRYWPTGLTPDALAPGMMVASCGLIAIASLAPGIEIQLVSPAIPQLGVIGVQAFVFALQFALVFILQKSGGPVFLSLLGSVAAVVGILIAHFALGESLPPGLLYGGAGITAGILLMTIGHIRMQESKQANR